jgi:magnesium chelatase family protein
MQQGITSATLIGVEAILVHVEVDLAGGLPLFTIVGLAEASVRESAVRVRAAMNNSGFLFPSAGRTSVNLAPANLKKAGTGFDLPIALGVLAAQGVIPPGRLADTLVLGELSLSGELRPVRGILAAAEAAKQGGCTKLLVAAANADEASLLPGVEARAVVSLRDAVAWLRDGSEQAAPRLEPALARGEGGGAGLDLADVRGQPFARRALEVAAAGGHNLLLCGGPGSGKTMLARRLPGVLPPLSDEEALAVTRVQSAAGLLSSGSLVRERPFRAPHHSTTPAGLVGGGAGVPRPGELSLAHLGVLFLDELPEFSRPTLEVLRQPMEAGEVILSRAWGSVRLPACAQVVAAMNPCPCGRAGDGRARCRCLPHDVARYRGRVSGPLLDRIDLHIQVPPVDLVALEDIAPGEGSAAVRRRVADARALQRLRLGARCNARMTAAEVREHATPDAEGRRMLAAAVERLGLTARGWDRALRVARTLADLEGEGSVRAPHMAEALMYREDVARPLAA